MQIESNKICSLLMKKFHFCIYILLFLFVSSTLWIRLLSYPNPNNENHLSLTSLQEVSSQSPDTLYADTVDAKKQSLDAPVEYVANDSIVFTSGNMGYLYGDSKIDYQTMSIKGEQIIMSMDSSIVHAKYGVDSIGKEFGFPVFTENGTDYEMKSVSYNFKSKKGYIRNVITQEGDGYIVAEKAKKNADDSFFMCNGKYTTCDHHDHPHFYLMLTKAKVKPKKNVVTGPAYLVIEGLPLPLAIPFGFFPFSEKYSSGIIMPSYGDDMDRGFNLRNGGYYFAISDYMDLALTGEIYTKGSWGLNARSNYKKRYRYSGNFDLAYLYTKYGDRSVPQTFQEAKDFRINWQHAQDPKANMYRTLSANVQFQTGSFSRYNQESQYSMASVQNTRNSSVTLTQTFPNSPFTLSANMSAAQVMADSTVSLTLPNIMVSMNRIYPFKRKKAIGSEKWYEKIQFSYNGDLRNSIKTKTDKLMKSGLRDWENAMQHRIPVSATFSLFNYINVTPSFNYTERWYTRKITQMWDSENKRITPKDTINEFNRVYDFSYSVAFQTKMYGFYEPIFKIGKLQRIRHVFTPTITFGGNPDFSGPGFGYYDRFLYYDANGEKQEYIYSPYQYEIFGVPGRGKQSNINFNFENNLEMKVGTRNDSTKIISLIDNLGINFSYNMAADSLKWSDISTNLRLKLSKSLTVNVNATFDPYTYVYDETKGVATKVDRLRVSKNGSLGRLMRTGFSISPSINQDTFKKWFGKAGNTTSNENLDGLSETEQNLLEGDDSDPFAAPKQSLFSNNQETGEYDSDGFLKNNITWNLTFNYTMNYGYDMSSFNIPKLEYNRKLTQNLGINGSIQPTKNWNFSFMASYDFNQSKIAYMNCTIGRDLHCWNISASFIPIGPYTSYYVSLRVNSSMLQDLKYEQRSRRSSYDPVWK